jgi:hypothetical protein
MTLDPAIAAAERSEAARHLIAQAQLDNVDLVTVSALELCVLGGLRQPLLDERVAQAWSRLGKPWLFDLLGVFSGLALISIGLLYRSWPTGIRIDDSGISIGAVRSAKASSREPTVSHQSRGLFTCPWPAVLELHVVTRASCGN